MGNVFIHAGVQWISTVGTTDDKTSKKKKNYWLIIHIANHKLCLPVYTIHVKDQKRVFNIWKHVMMMQRFQHGLNTNWTNCSIQRIGRWLLGTISNGPCSLDLSLFACLGWTGPATAIPTYGHPKSTSDKNIMVTCLALRSEVQGPIYDTVWNCDICTGFQDFLVRAWLFATGRLG